MEKENSRTINSLKNSIVSIIAYIIPIIIAFIAQAVFLRVFNKEYNGIKGLFNNILNMLNVIELGFGSAIIYNLYEPVAKKDRTKIRALVKFYKTVYHIIAGVIFVLGVCLLPIIPIIVGDVSIVEDVRIIFFLYLLSTVASYLLTYKRSILYADQKEYITKLINCIFVIIRNGIQIFVILYTRNFILYLLTEIGLILLENISINILVDKKYDYLKDLKSEQDISKEVKNDIITKVKGLLFHRVGTFIVASTDNIIVSMTKTLGVAVVGVYSNYNMIIYRVTTLFANVITSLTASVGNLLVNKQDADKARNIYKSMFLLNSWIFCFACAGIVCVIEPFVKIWIGTEYILPKLVLYVLVVNMYLQGIRKTNITFKEAAGIFYEDRFIPLIEAILNLVASLVLIKFFGLAGVFMGTILSEMIWILYSYPKYLYKSVLNGTYLEYILIFLKYTVLSFIIVLFTMYLSTFIKTENLYLQVIDNSLLCCLIPNILYFIVVRKFPEFKFYDEKIKSFINKKILKSENKS